MADRQLADRLGQQLQPHGSEARRRHHLAHGEELCPDCRDAAPAADPLAVVTRPGVRHGQPSVGQVAVEHVAGMVWAGEPVAEVAEEYGLTREQVLLACWHHATHGPPHYQAVWLAWLARSGLALSWQEPDWAAVPGPPSREVAGRG